MPGQVTSHLIARNIRAARDERDLTQRELANRLDCEPALVSKWETGRHTPSRYYMRALAKTLGHDREWFLADHGDTPVAA